MVCVPHCWARLHLLGLPRLVMALSYTIGAFHGTCGLTPCCWTGLGFLGLLYFAVAWGLRETVQQAATEPHDFGASCCPKAGCMTAERAEMMAIGSWGELKGRWSLTFKEMKFGAGRG